MKALVTNDFSTSADAENTAEHPWTGTALLRPGILAFEGEIWPTELHAHHAVQIVAACTPIVVVDGSGVRRQGTHIIVPTDAPHRVAEGAVHGIAVYLDPETTAGAAADRRAHLHGWVHALGVDPAHGGLAGHVRDVLSDLLPDNGTCSDGPQGVVTAALQLLPELVRDGSVRGSDVARQLGISATRLTHLFTEQVGIPLRRYILWLRLYISMTRVMAGDDVAAAADAAGFADCAQLTRTCRRTFGLPPSMLSRDVEWDIAL
ncbi:helix-turn-helix domain-containing protein [Nocardia brasiliensis]|uniref:helix-turn-helix domain-containing protein n=1 Tax=Nocardia brasiliensis TaxID=37326 RepID=UPI001893A1EA|nr:helix-turn-helix domain-containing protein [Nocardia brasiliensis]MBF6125962.1 helix-turn-helix transcriptional regulator [Nocardia brasiliensis]MBF6543030.1 helix-turn-helix transcriptional regulator [Nocardia brasiliensis]